MSKFRIVNLFDKLFISISVFLIAYAWINFYISNLWTTFILSLIFSFACLFVLFYFMDKKQDKLSLNQKKIDNINKYFLAFRLTPRKEKLNILRNILSSENEIIASDDDLIYEKEGKRHLVIIATQYEKLSENDLLNIAEQYAEYNVDAYDIICNDTALNINKNFSKRSITFINKQKLYTDYFERYSIFPDCSMLNSPISKVRFKDIVKNMFLPHKAKSYFFCGLILIFSSIILPYHIYYVIFGSLLLAFSVACKVIPRFSNK